MVPDPAADVEKPNRVDSCRAQRSLLRSGFNPLIQLGWRSPDCPVGKRARSVTECRTGFSTFGAFVEVRSKRLRLVRGEFAVDESHDFFGSEWMRDGAHVRSPFWAVVCACGEGAP